MTRTLDEVVEAMPVDQQRDIAAKAAQLIDEEMRLRDLRAGARIEATGEVPAKSSD